MQVLMQPMVAGFSILQLILISVGVIATLTLAAAAGFYIARRYYTTDTNARMGLYQRELVRQKRRSTDGSSQSTLMRRERDRARRHVQRTVRLRQTAQAKSEGRPVKRQYAPVNILRPMTHSQQATVGSVWEPEGALNRVRESAKSLLSTFSRTPAKSPVDDGIDALIDDAAKPTSPLDTAAPMLDEPTNTWTAPEPAARPAARPAPTFMRREQAQTMTPMAPAAPQRSTAPGRLNAVMGRAPAAPAAAPAMQPSMPVEPTAYDSDIDEPFMGQQPTPEMASQWIPAPLQTALPVAAPAPVRQPVPAAMPIEPRMVEPVQVPQAPVAAEAVTGGRASSADLKRRLAQVRERNSAQRAQMAAGAEPMRKTS